MSNIVEYLNRIKNAIYGKDVRNAIHDSIEAINNESVQRLNEQDQQIEQNTTKQNLLEQKYDEQIENIASGEYQNAEIVDARCGFNTLGNLIKKKVYHFDCVDDMKNCLGLRVGDYIVTKGYYEANDGGGAEYYVTQNQDNSTYQENANGLYFTLIYNNKINVKQIGLKDDPDFDNTDLLDKIIGIQYDTLIFPKGQYKIMAFDFPGDITIEGNGSILNCILNTDRLVGIGRNSIINNLTINSLNEDKEWNRIDFTNKHNIKFNNCKFSGFRQTTLNPQSAGYNVWPILLKDCSDIEFNNCLFDNNSFQDILIEYNVSNVIFNNVNSVDGRGVYVDIEPSQPYVSKNITFINTVFRILHTYEYYNYLDTLLNCSFIDCIVNELTYHRWKFGFYKYPN